jgi:hypothetical protein
MALLLLACLGFVALAAGRGPGWLGLPLSCLLSLLLLFAGVPDSATIAACSIVAAVCAVTLPRPDRFAAAGVGSMAAILSLFVLPFGGHSPLGFYFGCCSAGFAVGGLAGGVATLLRRGTAGTL